MALIARNTISHRGVLDVQRHLVWQMSGVSTGSTGVAPPPILWHYAVWIFGTLLCGIVLCVCEATCVNRCWPWPPPSSGIRAAAASLGAS